MKLIPSRMAMTIPNQVLLRQTRKKEEILIRAPDAVQFRCVINNFDRIELLFIYHHEREREREEGIKNDGCTIASFKVSGMRL